MYIYRKLCESRKLCFDVSLRSEKPEDPTEACVWLLQKITSQLQEAKMWPVKLAGIKHQESLSTWAI